MALDDTFKATGADRQFMRMNRTITYLNYQKRKNHE